MYEGKLTSVQNLIKYCLKRAEDEPERAEYYQDRADALRRTEVDLVERMRKEAILRTERAKTLMRRYHGCV